MMGARATRLRICAVRANARYRPRRITPNAPKAPFAVPAPQTWARSFRSRAPDPARGRAATALPAPGSDRARGARRVRGPLRRDGDALRPARRARTPTRRTSIGEAVLAVRATLPIDLRAGSTAREPGKAHDWKAERAREG